MLRCELSAEIREADLGDSMTVDGAISSLNCIKVREYHGTRCITEMGRKQRELFKVFDVPVPKEAESGTIIFDF